MTLGLGGGSGGSSVLPSWGKQEFDAYLWRQESWSGTLSRATRPEFSPLLGGRGVATGPTVGNSGLCKGVLRARKAASAPSHTLELVPGLRTPVFLCLSWLHRWEAEPGQVGSALHAGQF